MMLMVFILLTQELYAVKLETITFEEMLELASQVARVLQTRSVALAMNYNVKLQVLSSFEYKSGTLIINERQKVWKKQLLAELHIHQMRQK